MFSSAIDKKSVYYRQKKCFDSQNEPETPILSFIGVVVSFFQKKSRFCQKTLGLGQKVSSLKTSSELAKNKSAAKNDFAPQNV